MILLGKMAPQRHSVRVEGPTKRLRGHSSPAARKPSSRRRRLNSKREKANMTIHVGTPSLHHASSWMPPSLLPPRSSHLERLEAMQQADEQSRIVAWRLHVRNISAYGLPSGAAFGRHNWVGLQLRFVAEWSHETKRTTETRCTGTHRWTGEHATLALPNPSGAGIPESEITVELCARVPGEPDEVIGTAKFSVASKAANIRDLEFIGPLFKGRTNATASFRTDVVGVTHAMAEREWGADAAVAEGGPPPSVGMPALAPTAAPQPSSTARSGSTAHASSAGSVEDEDAESDEDEARENRTASFANAASRPHASSAVTLGGDRFGGWMGHAAQPTTKLAHQMLEEKGYAPPPLPQPSLSTEPATLRFTASTPSLFGGKNVEWSSPAHEPSRRTVQQRTVPPRPVPHTYGFGSSVPRTAGPLHVIRGGSNPNLIKQGLPGAPMPAPAAALERMADAAAGRSAGGAAGGAASGAASGVAGSVGHTLGYTAPVRVPTSAETWLRPHSAPSARLLMQLDECNRIKAAFDRAGLRCPAKAIERGLLLPEDRPAAMCFSALPHPTHMRPGDEPPPKPKKKGGKKKGGKKKGGKSPGKKRA